MTPKAPTRAKPGEFRLPPLYSLFFLIVEPISALVGAYFAHFHPATYLSLTHAPSTFTPANFLSTAQENASIPLATQIVCTQLANLYLLFAINEAFVLRSTSDLRVWKTVLVGLLIADFGHLWSVRGLGWEIFGRFWEWNSMGWGNIGFVYAGATMRICFLSGVGLGGKLKVGEKSKEL